MKVLIYILLCLLTFQSYSCKKGDEDDIISTSQEFGIRHDRSIADYENKASSRDSTLPDFSTVVFFEYTLDGSNNYEFIATGILIDDNWVLTAGHNFYDSEEQASPAPISGIRVHFGDDPNLPNASYSVAQMVFHPSWEENNQDYAHGNDLCLIQLSSQVSNITPMVIYSGTDEPLDSISWFCGFGDYSSLNGQDPDLYSKKHAIENRLDRKNNGLQSSANGITYSGGLLAFDFDNPEGTINSLGDSFIDEDERTLGSGSSRNIAENLEGTTVSGDSGGPLFVYVNGIWQVAGILSGGASEPIPNHADGSYGDISIFTRVSSHYSWIQSVIQ